MGGAAPLESFECCEEDGIADNPMAVSVIFVPASPPVSHYDVRFMFADCVTNSQRALFIEWDLAIRVVHEDSIDAEQASSFLSSRALHFAVLIDGGVLRSSPLSQRKVHQHCRSPALGLLRKKSAHGEEAVPRMSCNRHDLAWMSSFRCFCREGPFGEHGQHRRTSYPLSEGTPVHNLPPCRLNTLKTEPRV